MDFGVVIPVADEGVVQLEACLGRLRAVYPEIPVCVVSDGVPDPEYAACCRRQRARYVQGAYLKRAECGGAWWRRLLELGLELKTAWIVKLDPDAQFHRPFRGAPACDVAGTLANVGTEHEHVQGGCQLIRTAAARTILASGLLEDPVLRNQRKFAFDDATYRRWRAGAYLCSDHTLAWMIRNLGLIAGDWSEVGSQWESPPPNTDLRHAVTHPHKLEAPPRFREASLRVITTCMGRLDHLKQTLPGWLAEPGVAVTVVDYGCPQGTARWVRKHHPEVDVVRVRGVDRFNLARARNVGAAHSPPGWWCFFDADLTTQPGWASDVRGALRHKHYLLSDPIDWGLFGSVVVHSDDYRAVGGYDELFRAWGAEDGEFYARLRQVGVRPGTFPGDKFASIPHSDATRTANYDVKSKRFGQMVQDAYTERKIALMLSLQRLPTREETLALWVEVCVELGVGASSPFYPCTIDIELDVEVFLSSRSRVERRSSRERRTSRRLRVDGPHPRSLCPEPAAPRALPPAEESPAPAAAPSHGVPCGVPSLSAFPVPAVNPPEPERAASPGPAIVVPRGAPSRREALINISVVNHATVDLGISLPALCKLGMDYLAKVVALYWPGKQANLIAAKQILPNTQAIIIMDDADQQGALGYHDVTPDGYPLAKVFAKTSMADGASLTEVFTHELAEMRCDPDCNLQATDSNGVIYALEVGDPVEESLFLLDGYRVSNVVTPAWFEPFHRPGSTRFDHMGVVSQPFQLAHGGYAVIQDPRTGQVQQIFGSVDKEHRFAQEDRRFHRSEIRKTRQLYSQGHAAPLYNQALGRRPILTHA